MVGGGEGVLRLLGRSDERDVGVWRVSRSNCWWFGIGEDVDDDKVVDGILEEGEGDVHTCKCWNWKGDDVPRQVGWEWSITINTDIYYFY